MNDVIENPSTDADHDDESVSTDTLRQAIAAGITPRWWSYSIKPDGGIDAAGALFTFADRVRSFGDIVSESDDETHVGIGHALGELSDEAIALVGVARKSETQQAPHTEASPRDDAAAKALLDRYLRRLTDVYPAHLAATLYGTALYARSDNLAELEKCVVELEGATFPGWPTGDVVSPRHVTQNNKKFEGATHVPGEDYLPLSGEDGQLGEAIRFFWRQFPQRLAHLYGDIVYQAAYRDWQALERTMEQIEAEVKA